MHQNGDLKRGNERERERERERQTDYYAMLQLSIGLL
jgi:hypothetical protein